MAIGACWGSGRGFLGASALVVLPPCKFGLFGYPCAIAFLHPLNKSVLRGFLGGFFGFIGARCIFDWLWLSRGLCGFMRVMLGGYRVKSENAPIFVGFAPMFSSLAVALVVACLVVIGLLLFFVGFSWVVGSFSLWTA